MPEMVISTCVSCRRSFGACPQCVNTIRIDPATGWPPDVMFNDDAEPIPNPNPDPDAVERSVQRSICDSCIEQGNPGRVRLGLEPAMTSEERHNRTHREY